MTFGKPKMETSTTNPYASAQPAIDQIIGAAGDWYGGKGGTQAPLNADTNRALNMTRKLAGQPVQGLAEANAFNTGLIANGGWTDDLRQVQDYLNPFARGDYTEDPRLAASIRERENRAMNGAATQFGGGRYGSAAIGQGMGSAMATAGNDMMLQSNENARNRQLQASGLLGNLGEGARGAALQASGMLPMLDNLKYAGAERLAGVGDYRQQRMQEGRDNSLNRLNSYADIIAQMGGMGRSTTAPKKGGGLAGLIGNVGTGAIAGGKIADGWGAVAGGGLGLLSSLF